MTAPPGDRRRVAVIGAGWAGCTAALELARRGLAVTVYEQARMPGGRARRVVVDGVALDNGQHLLIGAYRRVPGRHRRGPRRRRRRARVAAAAARAAAWFGSPARSGCGVARAGARHPPPGAVGARRLAPGAPALAARLPGAGRDPAAIPATATVADWFRDLPRAAFDGIVAPLCVAALNTLPEEASARVFAKVLDTALGGSRTDSDFLVPTTDLSSLLPEPALRQVAAQGGQLRPARPRRCVASAPTAVTVDRPRDTRALSDVVVAVGPHQLAQALGARPADLPGCRAALAMAGAFAYEPIVTVYLGFRAPVAMTAPVMRLDDRPGQWLFDRRGGSPTTWPAGTTTMLAVVISAHGTHQRMEREALAAAVEAQLRRLAPGLPTVTWSRVITERRATYACTPGLARPAPGRLAPGIHLAGDYTDAEFPATLEAAVRSGRAAATGVLEARAAADVRSA
ncbi:MAG: FAD-dependent oxidoreductase [Betaproteobacteria bacterium]|nr:FAD-dependent oxidoreductase [Betaproteobacteria bacterium]